jgi:hypothetical protein
MITTPELRDRIVMWLANYRLFERASARGARINWATALLPQVLQLDCPQELRATPTAKQLQAATTCAKAGLRHDPQRAACDVALLLELVLEQLDSVTPAGSVTAAAAQA